MLVKARSPIDSLLAGSGINNFWPDRIMENPKLIKSAGARKELYVRLDNFFGRKAGVAEVVGLYDRLADFLLADTEHGRLILYLPFEILPDGDILRGSSRELAEAAARFIDAYMASWRFLLRESDCRANFTDGDVLDFSPGDLLLPNVRKAAHLIPELVKRKMLSVEDVIDMLDTTDDGILMYSILDVLPMLSDLELLPGVYWERLMNSANPTLDKTALIQFRNLEPNPPDPQILSSTSPTRAEWLRRELRDRRIEAHAMRLTEAFKKAEINLNYLTELARDTKTPALSLAGIISARSVAGDLKDEGQLKAIVSFLGPIFRELWFWPACPAEVKDQLFVTWLHWRATRLIDDVYLEDLGLKVPRLDTFAIPSQLIDDDLEELRPLLESACNRPEVRELIYPVCVFYGSKLKGYSLDTGFDWDLAILIKPGVNRDKKERIRQLLGDVYDHPKVKGKVLEFWLEESAGAVKIINLPTLRTMTADSSWVHVLLCGVWLGEEETISELFKRLLSNLFFSAGETIDGEPARRARLRMMEMEALQYRLMHKGYRRCFPREKSIIWTPRSWPLGPESDFWDRGYRQVASKLFVTRVFLPELS